MPNHRLTREQQSRGGANWSPAKAASVGVHFERHNDEQRAAAQKRYERVKLLRDNGLSWREVGEFLGESPASVKALFYKLRDRSGDPLPPRTPATHCKRGHLLSGDNLYEYNGVRHCRACKVIRQREARQAS
jgi:hypothetical protein